MHFQRLALAITAALLAPVNAHAAAGAAAAAAADTATDLDRIVVTSTRTEVKLADSITPVQVIDREDIERSQASSLPELLRGRAGIDIGNQGGLGKLSTVFIRGTESDHVLVLVDGIRMGSATAGLVSFQDLPVDQIDRIEIARGPRSSLYGSEAIGGVIQIFTRRDQGAFTPRARVGIGSNNLREASAGIGAGGERGWFGADLAYQRSDGFNSCNGSATLFQGCYVDEPDRDGYRNTSFNLRGGVDITDALTLEGTGLRAEASNEFDGSVYGGNESENVQQAVGGKLLWTPSQRFKLTTQLGRSNDDSENFYEDSSTPRTKVGEFDTRRDTASMQGDIGLSDNQLLTLGIDWLDDTIDSDTAFDVTSRDNTGLFAEYQGTFGSQQWQASVRSDDNEQFGQHTTGSLGWGMRFANDVRINASAASGFKAPSFNDLYYPYFGNPNLRPEQSEGYNLGISRYLTASNWTINAYETRVDDLISYDASIFLPNNVDKARIRGIEATFDTTLLDWTISTQLSHVDPRNRSGGANDGKLLARRARDTGRIDLDRAFGAFRFGTTLSGAGKRYDDAANSVRLGGYATFDLRLAYAFHSDWTLEGHIDNVFDKHYETVAWYNQPGREYGLSLRYSPTR